MSILTPLNIEHIERRVAALSPERIAEVASRRHVQSVIEDLQRDVRQLVAHIDATQQQMVSGDPEVPR